ncbi:BMP family ABC transporter substrate-binding protein [Oscillospiraceae bacterium]|nr:BMP family ABC transporter substrate-binding protein [Oscillospiraceae bacterium]
MKKKYLSLLLAGALSLSLAACGGQGAEESKTPEASAPAPSAAAESAAPEGKTIKVGMINIGDENDQGYTYNFMRGKEEATKLLADQGINVEWVVKNNINEDSSCEDANIELADEGCELIINTSYGFEPFMLKVAPDYKDIQFVSCTNMMSALDDLDNTHNAFANIFEGRYLAGVVGGMKLQQMIDEGEIKENEALIGYVGAFPYSEVVSGFTSFYLGAKSVCPSATMRVKYVNSWSDAPKEANAASALADEGCKLISQHSDNTTPATSAQSAGAFHCGYNNDMTGVAPDASLVSTRIDWSVYFEYCIKTVAEGGQLASDWTAGMGEGAVVLTQLNEKIAAPGTAEKVAEVEKQIADGTIHPFQGPWTGIGTAFGADAPDTKTMAEGEFYDESNVAAGAPSAPQFYWIIDGITEE